MSSLNLLEKTLSGRRQSCPALSFVSRFVFAVDFFLVFPLSFLLLNIILHLHIRHLTRFSFIRAFTGHVSHPLTIITFHRGSFSPVGSVNIHCVGVLLPRGLSLLRSSGLWPQLEHPGLPSPCILAVILSWWVRLRLLWFIGFFLHWSICFCIEGFFCLRNTPLPVNCNGFIVPLVDRYRLRSFFWSCLLSPALRDRLNSTMRR